MSTHKVIRLCVAAVFFAVSCTDFSYAFRMRVNAPGHTLCLPQEIGKVTDEYQGKDNRLIYFIQDVHCDPDTQKQIQNIVSQLKEYHGDDLSFIGQEGSFGEIDTRL